MVSYGFVIDNRRCIGCHACTVACKAENEVPLGVNRTWVKYIEKGEFPQTRRSFSVMRCNHCANAPCVEICPVTALFTRPDGIVDFESQRCVGCKACLQACPYDALYIDPYEDTAAKCNYCSHRIDVGLEPPCVTVCPTQAIISGDLDDPDSEIARLVSREAVQVRKPEKGAAPKLFYIEGDAVSLNPLAAVPAEAYMWSEGEILREPQVLGWPSIPRQDRKGLRGRVTSALGQVARRVYDPPRERVAWGWKVSGYILTKSVSAGAFAIPLVAFGPGHPPGAMGWAGAVLSLVFLGLTCLLLVKDLRRQDRFLYVFLRPQWRSWLVRGGYILLLFGLTLLLWLAGGLIAGEGFQKKLTWPGFTLSVLAAVYTAFLLAQAKGRDFWQSPFLCVHLLLHAALAGAGVLLLFGKAFYPAETVRLKEILLLGLLVNLLALLADLLFPHATEDARAAARAILRGAGPFWVGVVGLGHGLSAGLLLSGGDAQEVLGVLLSLGGLFLAAHLWITTPQRIPLS